MSGVSKKEWQAILARLEHGERYICHAAASIAAADRCWVHGLDSALVRTVQRVLHSDGVPISGGGFESSAESEAGEAPDWVVALGGDPHARRIAYVKLKIAESE